MLLYFIQASCCWLIFHLVYTLFLRKETFFSTNRWYLLASIWLGLLLPLVKYLPILFAPKVTPVFIQPLVIGIDMMQTSVAIAHTSSIATWTNLAWLIYLLGLAFFLSKFLFGLFQIYGLYKNATVSKINGTRFAKTNTMHLPFSFFNTVFWSKELTMNEHDFDKIMQHEEGHIQQWHTFDVLFLELVSAFAWCCPPIWLYKKSLKETHEYLADAFVLATTETKLYGHLLLRQAQPGLQLALTNQFFHSQLKNRIAMMTKSKSQGWKRWKYTIGLSIFAVLLMAFSVQTKTIQDLIAKTGKTSFNWQVSSIIGTPFDAQKVEQTFRDKFSQTSCATRINEDGSKQPVSGSFDQSIRIASVHEVYRDMINIYPEHQNEINEILNQIFQDYDINAHIETNTIIYDGGDTDRGEDPLPIDGVEDIIEQYELGENPVIYYDGELFEGTLEELNTKQQEFYVHLAEKEALLKHGKTGKYGVLEVYSDRSVFESYDMEFDSNKKTNSKTDEEAINFFLNKGISHFKTQQGNEIDDMDDLNNIINANKSIDIKGLAAIDVSNPPYIVVYKNGQKIEVDLPKIKPEQIESVKVLKGDKALLKYGQKGEHGVIEITLKEDATFVPSSSEQETTTEKMIKESKDIFITAEEMPRFPGCEDIIDNKAKRKECCDMKLLDFIYTNIKYPTVTREAGIEGMAVVQFKIDIDGSVIEPKMVRSLDDATDKEVLQVVELMPKWIPGKQFGKVVKVQYTLPVKFKLEDGDVTTKKEKKVVEYQTLEVENFNLYPNPATDVVNIEFDGNSKDYKIRFADASGKDFLVHQQENCGKGFKHQFDLSQAPKGALFVTISQGEKMLTKKIIRQ